MSVSSTARRGAVAAILILVLAAGLAAGAVVFGPSQPSPGGAVGPPSGTPANPDPTHLRLKGTSTVPEGWSQSFFVVLAPSCPAGYHAAGGMIGAIAPLNIAIAANTFTRNEVTEIETQGFWLNSISGDPIAPGVVFTVYAECVKGVMPG
jgi:hypothetical protein